MVKPSVMMDRESEFETNARAGEAAEAMESV